MEVASAAHSSGRTCRIPVNKHTCMNHMAQQTCDQLQHWTMKHFLQINMQSVLIIRFTSVKGGDSRVTGVLSCTCRMYQLLDK
jgi:hypothetical protein